jgi:hypothetical protein
MLELQAVQRHLHATTPEAMLRPLLPYGGCIELLCQLPAAAQLSSAAVTSLLLQAIQQRETEAVFQLCRLPAAEQLTTEHAAQLLEACSTADSLWVDFRGNTIQTYIKELPAMGRLSSATLLRQLHAALDCRNIGYVNILCASPPAKHISSQALLPLLLTALTALKDAIAAASGIYAADGYSLIANALMELPVVSQLSSAEVSQ